MSDAEIWLVIAMVLGGASLVVVSVLVAHTCVFLSGQVLARWPCLLHSKQHPFSWYWHFSSSVVAFRAADAVVSIVFGSRGGSWVCGGRAPPCWFVWLVWFEFQGRQKNWLCSLALLHDCDCITVDDVAVCWACMPCLMIQFLCCCCAAFIHCLKFIGGPWSMHMSIKQTGIPILKRWRMVGLSMSTCAWWARNLKSTINWSMFPSFIFKFLSCL